MRSFYVYGFRHRGEYDEKSARGYDDERRRVESWLEDYMTFRQDGTGRRFFLSVDSRTIPHNPLYRAFRAKSFTDRDIMLHFHLMDILSASESQPLPDIMDALWERLDAFDDADYPDESTVRRKLAECEKLGLVAKEKRGRETWYRRTEEDVKLESWRDALDFFSEVVPLGVIGDYCRDKLEERRSHFLFKHHYILNALDSEVLLELVEAVGERREVTLIMKRRKAVVAPLKLYVSTQTGRQYVLAWTTWNGNFEFFRVDAIDSVHPGSAASLPEDIESRLGDFIGHVWGVSRRNGVDLANLEMTIYAAPNEAFIPKRLEREKRCGRVEQVDETHWRYTAQVYDALEMIPWIRSFIGRIVELKCDDARVTGHFRRDMAELAGFYGGDGDALS